MSGATDLERSVLERKERGELHVIAESLGLKPGTRTKKADLIDQILEVTGVGAPRVAASNADQEGHAGNGRGSQLFPTDELDARAGSAGPADHLGGGDIASAELGGAAGEVPGGTLSARGPAADDRDHIWAGRQAPGDAVEGGGIDEGPYGSVGTAGNGGEPARPALTLAGPAPVHTTAGSGGRGAGRDLVATPGSGARSNTGAGMSEPAAGAGSSGGNRADAASVGAAVRGDRAGSANAAPGAGEGGASSLANAPDRESHRPGRSGGDRSERSRDQPGGGNQGQGTMGDADSSGRRRRRRGRERGPSDREFASAERAAIAGEQPFTGEPVEVAGFLDLRDEGFGFVRASGFTASPRDVYVASVQVKRFGLRKGDFIEGLSRPAGSGEKFPALLRIEAVSGMSVDEARQRRRFEDLTPLFPDHQLRMETPGDPSNVTARIVDLMCPIGKGQRGLIVSPPKAGKTTVIKQIAKSIERNNPEVHLIVLLVDERPEEVTDMRRTVNGEVIASTFDRPADEHTQVAELALERAKRLVEVDRDVVIILDGITRLTRAYNLSAPASGRLTSGGIDQAAIYPPKKFFGAARNAEEGGSLTILATALVETGSKADDVIFEELKGTGNMELRLDRRLAERRLYPAIEVNASSTRHEELLFDRAHLQLVWRLRRVLNGLADDGTSWKALELLMDKIKTTRTNDEFLAEVARTQVPV